MQIVAVPLYDADMFVVAYMIRYLKENILFSSAQALNLFDGASRSVALEMLDLVGLDAFTLGKPLFVPINEIMLMGNLQSQCKESPANIIFVIEKPLSDEQLYLPKMQQLVQLGYRFALNYPYSYREQEGILQTSSFIFLSQRPENKEASAQALTHIRKHYPQLAPIATHIYNDDTLRSLYGLGYAMYESRFYRSPVVKGEYHVSPTKTSAIQLINTVQNENFDFDHVSSIVKRDPALTISLLRLVNSYSRSKRNAINSIEQAVAMMGQREIRKWVTTAVSKQLSDDRPDEITRISLLRAKFAENLAPLYDQAVFSGELFLMGLFSVLDVMLELPMKEALEMVIVSDRIQEALLGNTGMLKPVLNMVTDYENANWSSVSRHMITQDIADEALSKAYTDALLWYKNLILQEDSAPASQEGSPAPA